MKKIQLLIVAIVFVFASCSKNEIVKPTSEEQNTSVSKKASASRDNNLALGNPSGAGSNQPNNYLFNKRQLAISYNDSKGTPNWVSWHLSTAWFGGTGRRPSFYVDNQLPSRFTAVTTRDYTHSGFDRGHLCPSADRSGSVTDNYETFETTNIVPQAPNNNQQTWRYLEEYCRDLVRDGNELYIIAGVDDVGGTGRNGYETELNDKVTVPAHVWKVIVVLPNGSNDLRRIDRNTRVIAVYMPNSQSIRRGWYNYRVSVDYIERRTGYNFLSKVSSSIQSAIESKTDNVWIP